MEERLTSGVESEKPCDDNPVIPHRETGDAEGQIVGNGTAGQTDTKAQTGAGSEAGGSSQTRRQSKQPYLSKQLQHVCLICFMSLAEIY